MQAFKVGKLVTFVAIIILLVVAILSPYSLFKKIYFIIGVLIIGAISLGANKFFELVHSKFNKKWYYLCDRGIQNMNKLLRIITIVGVLIPLVVIWNLPEASSKEKILFTVIQLSIGFAFIIILEFIFRYKKKKESK